MLPDINAEERDQTSGGLERVLVSSGSHNKAVVGLVESQPAPATALNTDRNGGDGVLEALEVAVLSSNSILQLTISEVSTSLVGGDQVLPENGVVQMSAAVELDDLLEGNDGRDILLGLGLDELAERSVEVGHVGVVVLGVVDLHDLSRDEGLELAIVVGEVGEGEVGGGDGQGTDTSASSASSSQSSADHFLIIVIIVKKMPSSFLIVLYLNIPKAFPLFLSCQKWIS